MKLVLMSDSHSKHLLLDSKELEVEDYENSILIHAGDVSSRGEEYEIISFLNWFSSQPHKYKVFIAGNHDFYFEDSSFEKQIIPKNVIYLNEESVEIEGIKIFGSPIQPWFYDWAFNRERGEKIKKHWDLIPNDTDILITHGPPQDILDLTRGGQNVGCFDLLEKVMQIKPKYHIFGHIHEGYGVLEKNGTCFVNASVLDHRYYQVNKPIILDY